MEAHHSSEDSMQYPEQKLGRVDGEGTVRVRMEPASPSWGLGEQALTSQKIFL